MCKKLDRNGRRLHDTACFVGAPGFVITDDLLLSVGLADLGFRCIAMRLTTFACNIVLLSECATWRNHPSGRTTKVFRGATKSKFGATNVEWAALSRFRSILSTLCLGLTI
jgi:hypothetical protein